MRCGSETRTGARLTRKGLVVVGGKNSAERERYTRFWNLHLPNFGLAGDDRSVNGNHQFGILLSKADRKELLQGAFSDWESTKVRHLGDNWWVVSLADLPNASDPSDRRL